VDGVSDVLRSGCRSMSRRRATSFGHRAEKAVASMKREHVRPRQVYHRSAAAASAPPSFPGYDRILPAPIRLVPRDAGMRGRRALSG